MEKSLKSSSTRMRRVDQIQRIDVEADTIDTDETEELEYSTGPFYDKIYKTAEKFAGSYIGHYFTGKVDSLLKLIEDTAKWSLPLKNQNKNEAIIPLERPLPWIPFIALILILRLVRISLSIAGLFIGNAPLVPSDVVYFIQTRRRKLRSIRIAGMKEMRKKEQAQQFNSRNGLLFSLRALLSMALCRPKLCDDSHNISITNNSFEEPKNNTAEDEEEVQQNNKSSKNICNLEDSISDQDLTLNEILDKYGAGGNEDEDSDFVPPNDALLDADTSATSSSSSDEDTICEKEREIKDSQLFKTVTETESTTHMYNGNHTTEINDINFASKTNGGYLDGKLKKPKHMPKPLPEIKQEPVDSDDSAKQNCIVFEKPQTTVSNNIDSFLQQNFAIRPNNTDLHEQTQSIVEKGNQCTASKNVDINENGNDEHVDMMNADSDQICSQSGSPELCGTFGFQPTSILKNCQETNLQKRGHTEAFDRTEEFLRGETNLTLPSQPTKSTNSTGRSHKNKFRGRRR